MSVSWDYVLKYILVGDAGVGKVGLFIFSASWNMLNPFLATGVYHHPYAVLVWSLELTIASWLEQSTRTTYRQAIP